MATLSSRAERLTLACPVQLDHGMAITKDISASGVFFETDENHAAGSGINFAIELDGPQGKKVMFRCRGEIVRVERRDGKMGVAAKIVGSTFELID